MSTTRDVPLDISLVVKELPLMDRHITTIDDLIDALGGNKGVAELTGLGESAVSNWRARGYVPSGWHLRLAIELEAQGYTCSPVVFDLPPDMAIPRLPICASA